jgi:hypothetical protein
VQKVFQFLVALVVLHQFRGGERSSLLERRKRYVLRRVRFVRERTLDLFKVVRPDRHQSAFAADVLVQLVLQVDEGVVPSLVELYASQHGAHHEGTHEERLGLDRHLLSLSAVRGLDQPKRR